MANYASLKNIINQYITTNGQGEITGAILNNVLKSIVNSIGADFLFGGVVVPSSNVGSPDQNVFYIATQGGTYTNFGNVVIPNGITIFKWSGNWSNQILFAGDGGVFDITAYHNNTKYANLTAALGTNGANVPESIRKGGMSVKFVQSSDNKYVRFEYMGTEVAGTPNPFLDTNNWKYVGINVYDSSFDFSISDENDYDIVRFKNGHIRTKNFDSSHNATTQERGLMSAADKFKLSTIEEGAEVNEVNVNEEIGVDFSISDENGYDIVRFKNGHIRTKYFDSSKTLLVGKTYSILGDSISTFQGYLASDEAGYDGAPYAYFYPQNGLNEVNQTWWKKMETLTGLALLKNCSWSGSRCCGNSTTTNTAEAGCSTRRITDLSKNGIAPDIIIVYIGINDMSNASPYTLGSWTANDEIPSEGVIDNLTSAYALTLYKIMTAYPTSEVYCCSLLECPTVDNQAAPKTFPCINNRGNSLRDYNKAIEDICVGIGANFIDLHACGITYWNCSTYFLDTTHPNARGTTLMARYISEQILGLTKLKY